MNCFYLHNLLKHAAEITLTNTHIAVPILNVTVERLEE